METPDIVALGASSSYYIHFDDGSSCWEGLPTSLHNKLNGRQKSLPDVDVLALNPASNHEAFVQFEDGKAAWWVDDPEFSKEIHSRRDETLEHVALGPSGAWFLRWTDGYWMWKGLPKRLVNRLNGRQKHLPALEVVTMDDSGGYWVQFKDGSTWWDPSISVPAEDLIGDVEEVVLGSKANYFCFHDDEEGSSSCSWNGSFSFDVAMGGANLDPDEIRYTQKSISKYITGYEDYTIYDLADDLENGDVDVEDIDEIRVVKSDNVYWSLDNRRLWAFKKAELETVPVKFVEPDKAFWRKKSQVGNGLRIRVRGS
ncbi:hypothetical protein HK102_001531 [Quaeritorhiza haematococci]|nr:hypothetical protein HK102_001531 [Quaeritorhiza haematococci]